MCYWQSLFLDRKDNLSLVTKGSVQYEPTHIIHIEIKFSRKIDRNANSGGRIVKDFFSLLFCTFYLLSKEYT